MGRSCLLRTWITGRKRAPSEQSPKTNRVQEAKACPPAPVSEDDDETVRDIPQMEVRRTQSGVRPALSDRLEDICVNDRYLVRGVLGEGGVGVVYEAEHVALRRLVALKILRSTKPATAIAVKRFEREARTASVIGHPNVCKVFDVGFTDDGRPFVVMEKLVGMTLSQWVQKSGPLSTSDLGHVMRQLLAGLAAAHDRGIVHRDLKPDNVFLVFQNGGLPEVKILDFGVSKAMSETDGDGVLHLTSTGMIVGTPFYMSPEQARGELNLDMRTDIHACGLVMYEALTGRRPFLAPNYNALLLAIINTNPPPLLSLRPDLSPVLAGIVSRAMAKQKERRPPSAHALRDELGAFFGWPETPADDERLADTRTAEVLVPSELPEPPDTSLDVSVNFDFNEEPTPIATLRLTR